MIIPVVKYIRYTKNSLSLTLTKIKYRKKNVNTTRSRDNNNVKKEEWSNK